MQETSNGSHQNPRLESVWIRQRKKSCFLQYHPCGTFPERESGSPVVFCVIPNVIWRGIKLLTKDSRDREPIHADAREFHPPFATPNSSKAASAFANAASTAGPPNAVPSTRTNSGLTPIKPRIVRR